MYSYLVNQDPGNTMHIEIAFKDCDGNIISTLDSAKIKNAHIGSLYWIRDQPAFPQSWFIADSCTPSMSQCDFTVYWHEVTASGNLPHENTFTLTPQNWQ